MNIHKEIEKLGEMSETKPGVTRLAFTPWDNEATKWAKDSMREAGAVAFDQDPIGNLIGKWGFGSGSRILVGSHLDSVPNGGKYDGVAGVVLAIEAMNRVRPKNCDVVVFRCEESARFGKGLIGSAYATGLLPDEALSLRDSYNHNRFRKSLSDFVHAFVRPPLIAKGNYERYIEVHIEQGPVLEREGFPAGLVSSIAAPLRFEVTLEGESGHSGTVPMRGRKDALLAAAIVIEDVENIALRFPTIAAVLGTVGKIEVPDASINKIPGKCILYVDFRSPSREILDTIHQLFVREISADVQPNGVKVAIKCIEKGDPVDLVKRGYLEEAVKRLGLTAPFVVSGASHDATNVARAGIPTEMLFLCSRGGLSHCPEEYTSPEDLETGLEVLCEAIKQLDAELSL